MFLNAVQRAPAYKVAIYGPPGTGKTHMGATAPDPVILLLEKQGFETVRTAAKMTGRPMPPVFWIRNADQLRRARAILASSDAEPLVAMMRDETLLTPADVLAFNLDRDALIASLPYKRPRTVVVDSITEACEMIAGEVDAHGGTETKDGLTYRKLRAWGPIADKCTGLIRAFRDLPFHVLFLALIVEDNLGSDDEPDVHHRPALPGRKLWKILIGSVNACGLARLRYVVEEDGEEGKKAARRAQRFVQFITPDHIASKVASPLRAIEPADASAWFAALEHGVQRQVSDSETGVDEENEDEETKGDEAT